MTLAITKEGIDLGIVTNDGPAALAFYRDTLGFEHEADTPFPGGGTMHRLWCGKSLIKVVVPEPAAGERAPGAPIPRSTGYRYWTISVSNLEEMVARCKEAGYGVPVEPVEIRPGVTIAMLADPDGNWVELLQTA